jgi:hypothetical protein
MKKGVLSNLKKERWLFWLVSMICLIEAISESGFNFGTLMRDGAMHASLLWGILGYVCAVHVEILNNDSGSDT